MSAVFQAPQGLQDFLGTKASGRNPDNLLPTVQATLDIGRFLQAGHQLTVVTGNNVIAAQGFVSPAGLTVPAGKLWLVYSIACRGVALGAGDQLNFYAAVSSDGVQVWMAGLAATASQVNIAMGISSIVLATGPVLVGPSNSIGAYATQAAAVINTSIQTTVAYVELDY